MGISTRICLASVLAALGVVATAAPASAADPLSDLKAAVTARIDLRLAALEKDLVTINAAIHLTDEHRSQLSTVVENATAGLGELTTSVADRTTLAEVREDAASMINDFRVFLLVGPQVRLTVAGDAEQAALDKAQEAHDTLATRVAEKKAGGADTTAAETDLAEMQTAIDGARADLAGQVEALLAVVPGPDRVGIQNSVATVRLSLGSARVDLRTAAAEGRSVLAFLQG